jgi:hypothetical protein
MLLNLRKHSTLVVFRCVDPLESEGRFLLHAKQGKPLFWKKLSMTLSLKLEFKIGYHFVVVFRRDALKLFYVLSLLLLPISKKKRFNLICKKFTG